MKTIKIKDLKKIKFSKGYNVLDSLEKTFGCTIEPHKGQLKFNWDLTDVDSYTDYTDENFVVQLVEATSYLSKITIETGVKGKKELKLMNATVGLQAGTNCDVTFEDVLIPSGVELEVKPVYVAGKICNEDLNGTWMQLVNVAGAMNENAELPLQDIILALILALAKKANERIVWLGNTGSSDDTLSAFDGFIHLWDNDTDVANVPVTGTGFSNTNAYGTFLAIYNAVPEIVKNSGVQFEIVANRVAMQYLREQIWNTKDFNAELDWTVNADGSVSCNLPATDVRIHSTPYMPVNKAYAVIPEYMYYGTDEESDLNNGYRVVHNIYNGKDQLEMSLKWKAGVQYVRGEYFRKLNWSGS